MNWKDFFVVIVAILADKASNVSKIFKSNETIVIRRQVQASIRKDPTKTCRIDTNPPM